MMEAVRYAKTEKGVDEIMARRNNLRGKLRTMLILTDASKSVDALREQGARVGVQSDFLESLAAEGYIALVGAAPRAAPPATIRSATAPTDGAAAAEAVRVNGDAAHHSALPRNGNGASDHGLSGIRSMNAAAVLETADAGVAVSVDELSRFREAKSYMNDTVVTALGLRAFVFTLRLERCSTRAELGNLMPDYEKALRKVAAEPEARVMAERLRVMLA